MGRPDGGEARRREGVREIIRAGQMAGIRVGIAVDLVSIRVFCCVQEESLMKGKHTYLHVLILICKYYYFTKLFSDVQC